MTYIPGKTYESVCGPGHVTIREYAENANQQYSALLSENPPEGKVQRFLEEHPCFVPGHSTPIESPGHSPLHLGLITQPELPGQQKFIPDFMWITTNSAAWFPTLIEIEKPGKKIFTKKGVTTSDFNQARDQLAQWRSWFNDPSNVLQFMKLYGIPEIMRRRIMRLHMILIFGRRSEFDEDPRLIRQRGSLLTATDETLMSFDRLSAETFMHDAITIRAVGFGRYKAVWIPPVFETGADLADRLLHIDGITEAIDQNPEIDKERREFLKQRIAYGKEWASSPELKILSSGHRE